VTAPQGLGEAGAGGPVSPAPVIDSQVHVWLRPGGRYPWAPGFLDRLPSELAPRYSAFDRSAGELVEMMDQVGVTTTLLTSPWLYGSDHSYAFDSAEQFPGRFVVVGPYDLPLADPATALALFRAREHALGPRIFLASPSQPDSGAVPPDAVDGLLAAAADLGVPVFVSPIGRLDELARAARAFPEVILVLDHAGLWLPAPVERRWELLPAVLELASYPNIMVKCSALPELSTMKYPYPDLWRILHPLLERFGPHRLIWGSDINQHRDQLSYAQSLDYIRDSSEISGADRAQILGANAARLLAATPAAVGAYRRTQQGG
jgi:L-fuconolactonase